MTIATVPQLLENGGPTLRANLTIGSRKISKNLKVIRAGVWPWDEACHGASMPAVIPGRPHVVPAFANMMLIVLEDKYDIAVVGPLCSSPLH